MAAETVGESQEFRRGVRALGDGTEEAPVVPGAGSVPAGGARTAANASRGDAVGQPGTTVVNPPELH